MKIKMSALIMFIVCAIAFSQAHADSLRKVKKVKDGMYTLEYQTIVYTVDTIAKLCFAQNTAPTVIDCSHLALRPEWAPIITWVPQQSQTTQSGK